MRYIFNILLKWNNEHFFFFSRDVQIYACELNITL
jgi:hypothetical protein